MCVPPTINRFCLDSPSLSKWFHWSSDMQRPKLLQKYPHSKMSRKGTHGNKNQPYFFSWVPSPLKSMSKQSLYWNIDQASLLLQYVVAYIAYMSVQMPTGHCQKHTIVNSRSSSCLWGWEQRIWTHQLDQSLSHTHIHIMVGEPSFTVSDRMSKFHLKWGRVGTATLSPEFPKKLVKMAFYSEFSH